GLAGQQVGESASQAPAVRQISGEASWLVKLPSWRLDLEREIDLIEEVARVLATIALPTHFRPSAKESRLSNGLRVKLSCAARCSRWDCTRPSAAPSAPRPMQH